MFWVQPQTQPENGFIGLAHFAGSFGLKGKPCISSGNRSEAALNSANKGKPDQVRNLFPKKIQN